MNISKIIQIVRIFCFTSVYFVSCHISKLSHIFNAVVSSGHKFIRRGFFFLVERKTCIFSKKCCLYFIREAQLCVQSLIQEW